MRVLSLFFVIISVSACNSIHIKPNTLDKNQIVYADRGGYTMARAIKERMEKRGYHVVVGKSVSDRKIYGEDIDIDVSTVPNEVKYVVKVKERKERFAPVWCVFNGMWWWRFNVSIASQQTGEELLSWFGYGCENSSLRKLDKILDELEIKNYEPRN